VLSLNTEHITSDVMEFETAIEQGDRARAATLYEAAGPFLDGVHLSDAGELERWIDSVRDRLAGSYREALEALATEASVRGDHAGAVTWWRKLAAQDRLSSRVALGLMRALAAAGDRGGALEFARVHESIVRIELESAPDAAVMAFAEELRASRTAAPPARVEHVPASPADHSVPSAAPFTVARQPRARRGLRFAPLTLLVPLAIYGLMRARRSPADASTVAPSRAAPSIAVLPLVNVSGDPKNESFVDGMTAELTTDLGRIDSLHVAANTWAMAFKGHRTDVRQIADSLHVSHLLEGELQLIEGRIRLYVRLVDAATGSTRWAHKYDRKLTDAFAVQADIGDSVAKALEVRLVAVGRARAVRHMTTDPVAYDLYVRGRNQTGYRSQSGISAAIDYLSQAVARDSTFAVAYAELAHAYRSLEGSPQRPRRMLIDSAEKAALKAVSLDDSLAQGHAFLAFAKLRIQDFRGASMEVNRALELDPHEFFAHTVLALLYNWSGRHEDAVAEYRRTVDTDPSPLAQMDLAHGLFFAGRDDEALTELEPLRELRPPLHRTPQVASEIYLHKKMWEQAVREARSAPEMAMPDRAALGLALGKSGDRAGAMQILQELKARPVAAAAAFYVAVVYVGLGDYDSAFLWLDKSIDDHSVTFAIMDPTFAELRRDPRFARFRKRLGVDAIQLK
jgi:TolB-like protein/DNA-binding SARP family transcriptional activator